MKIIFLDEYSLGGIDLTPIQQLCDYEGYEITHTAAEIIDRAKGAEVVITNKCNLAREVLTALAPTLQLVCIAATGMNNIDLEAAAELGIEVRNAVGYSTHSVAEATLAAALTIRRQISYFDRFVKSGAYSATDRLFCFDRPIGQLHGSRWGIVGLGAIGREVARIATALGCEVRYYSTSGVVREESVERAESLSELLAWCDTLSIHSPLNDQTRGLIGATELSTMKPNAIIVNVARGGILDETALAAALDNGTVAAAALDVFACEPLNADSPLLKINDPDRLLLSPHNAWASTGSIERLVNAIAWNIKSTLK
ncbi:MAG: NAD(P)-dependent oxidoreductase [Rikenellaceae bacterium]